ACSYATTDCSLATPSSLASTTNRRQIFFTAWFFVATACSLATPSSLATTTKRRQIFSTLCWFFVTTDCSY
ncbi:Uncharacterized protein APZ42_010400, partial [Daphnia magna]